MTREWLIIHGGALGDLLLTIQLALRLPGVGRAGLLRVVSRIDPGDLSTCRPAVLRTSSEGLGLHWLFQGGDEPPPERLRDLVRNRYVLNTIAGRNSVAHRRLVELGPAQLLSIDQRLDPDAARHATQQWQAQLEAQGLLLPKCIHQHPEQRGLGVPDMLRERGRSILRQHAKTNSAQSSGPVLIHPGSGGRAKCWPLGCYTDVAGSLRDDANTEPVFVVGAAELERWRESELAALEREFGLLRCPSPDELVALLAAARAYLGNDAGPTHLAALLGTPTVAVFGPTRPNVWRPLGPRVTVLSGDAGNVSWGISVDHVREALAGLLVI